MPEVPLISIVDDDPSVRVATHTLVRSLGYIVHAYASAESFLLSPHVNDTACVIADIQMPGMSGVELQDFLIAQGRCPPIIFITAFPEEHVRMHAMKAGAVCFLSKPFDGKVLGKWIDVALRARGG